MNRAINRVDSELILAEEFVQIDDEDLLDRYRYTLQDGTNDGTFVTSRDTHLRDTASSFVTATR